MGSYRLNRTVEDESHLTERQILQVMKDHDLCLPSGKTADRTQHVGGLRAQLG
jgi:hypothetical protein